MKILHLLTSGGVGGIETLVKDYSIFSSLDNTFLFAYKGGDIAEEMVARGDNCIVLKHSKKSIFKTYNYIDRLCKEQNFSAIVVQPAAPILYLYALKLKKKYNIKFFAYAHSDAYDMVRFNEKNAFLRKSVMGYTLNRADGIIAISKYVKETVHKIFDIDNSKIEVIYNGANVSKFQNAEESVGHTEGLEIVYVGRLIKEKGVHILIEALSKIDRNTKVSCRIIGSGIYEEELKKLVSELNVEDRVKFMGRRRDVEKYLAQADVFVHAALWQEGFGITIVEAMAAGKICICSECGAIPEIIDNNVDGILFEQGNASELAHKIEEVSEMPQYKRIAMKNKAMSKAKKFDINSFVKSLDGYIEKMAF